MLKMRNGFSERGPMNGFSLIELMIAMVLGLVVVGAAIVLIVAINQSNSETIQSTRLTQELRTLAAVIADDVKRARRVEDPVSNIGQGTTTTCTGLAPAQPCYAIDTATVGCIAFGYTGLPSHRIDPTADDSNYKLQSRTYNYHSIRRVVAGGVGSVEFAQVTFDPVGAATGTALPVVACPMANGQTTTLNANQIDVTALTFTSVGASEIDMTISGRFRAGDNYTKAITRSFTQPIFIRSVSVN